MAEEFELIKSGTGKWHVSPPDSCEWAEAIPADNPSRTVSGDELRELYAANKLCKYCAASVGLLHEEPEGSERSGWWAFLVRALHGRVNK